MKSPLPLLMERLPRTSARLLVRSFHRRVLRLRTRLAVYSKHVTTVAVHEIYGVSWKMQYVLTQLLFKKSLRIFPWQVCIYSISWSDSLVNIRGVIKRLIKWKCLQWLMFFCFKKRWYIENQNPVLQKHEGVGIYCPPPADVCLQISLWVECRKTWRKIEITLQILLPLPSQEHGVTGRSSFLV